MPAPDATARSTGAWSAPDSLGHAVWQRHAWGGSAGMLDFRVQASRTGMADIGRRHLAFVQRMLDATERAHMGIPTAGVYE